MCFGSLTRALRRRLGTTSSRSSSVLLPVHALRAAQTNRGTCDNDKSADINNNDNKIVKNKKHNKVLSVVTQWLKHQASMTNWGPPTYQGWCTPHKPKASNNWGPPTLQGWGGGTDCHGEGGSRVPQGVRSGTLGNLLQRTSPGRVAPSADADPLGSVAQQSRSPKSGPPDFPGRSGAVVA